MSKAEFTPWQRLVRRLLGKPIATSKAHHEKLSPMVGLAVFASDSLSSVAYATEAILAVLVLKSAESLGLQMPISIAIVALIAIIAMSYRQTIKAYSQGGGSYIVASDNLGPKLGLVAGAALLIDYILTVAVSVAAGVAAITSAIPALHAYLVPLSVVFISLLAYANLRGLKESGAVFAFPTYGFVAIMYLMLAVGIARALQSGPVTQTVLTEPGKLGSEANWPFLFLLARAFAAGCTALTGIEAVSDGTQSFQKPEQKNAANTLVRMAIILSTLFLGMGYLVQSLPEVALYSAKNPEFRTLASQIAAYSFGQGSILFYAVQAFTALILLLAANTAFADFPRVCSFLARDGYMPRYMARLGDRLVFHNGILMLAVMAIVLVFVFHGELDGLLPLYAVGVFTAFSLSQAGMVAHWLKKRTGNWRSSVAINLVGCTLCVIVLGIILVTKFTEGAWVIAVLLPILYTVMNSINRYYKVRAEDLSAPVVPVSGDRRHIALLLVPRVHRGMTNALSYARNLRGEVQAVHVTLNERTLPELQRQWEKISLDVPLVILPSPYRSLIDPVLEYVDELREEDPTALITVIVSEAVSAKWYERLLTENVAGQLRVALAKRKNVVVASIRHKTRD
jgi:amino acid transporter